MNVPAEDSSISNQHRHKNLPLRQTQRQNCEHKIFRLQYHGKMLYPAWHRTDKRYQRWRSCEIQTSNFLAGRWRFHHLINPKKNRSLKNDIYTLYCLNEINSKNVHILQRKLNQIFSNNVEKNVQLMELFRILSINSEKWRYIMKWTSDIYLSYVIISIAFQRDMHTFGEESTKTLASRTFQRNINTVRRKTFVKFPIKTQYQVSIRSAFKKYVFEFEK